MATKERRGSSSRRASDLRYFYLNGNLYKILRVVRALDQVEVWNFTEGKREGFVWSDVRKRAAKAFTLTQVAKMIGRHRVVIENYILEGHIRQPQKIYTLTAEKRPGKYMMSEEDVFELHDYLMTVHIGRPRKDGRVTPGQLPTKAELRALMKHDTVMYVKTDNDTFVPAWKENDW